MTAVATPLILSAVYESGGGRRCSSHEMLLLHLSVQAPGGYTMLHGRT
jgi:hypothetical protein